AIDRHLLRRRRDRRGRFYGLACQPRDHRIGICSTSQIAAKAEDTDRHACDHDNARYQIVALKLGFADLAKTSACKYTPVCALYLFAAIRTKSGPKEHAIDLC